MGSLWDRAGARTLEAVTGRSVPLDATTLGFTRREPYGVVAAIVPFNSPQGMASSKAALALAAGNTVVLKPPEQASPAILRFAELAAQVLPPGALNVVSGLGAEVGDPLVRHPDVRKITMTGSPGTARAIQRAAADNLTSAIFELGGKSPNIVFPDADLDRAALGVTVQAIYTTNAGQACVGGSRILIQRSILDEMLGRMEKIIKGIKLGDPFDPETTMGPLISKAQFDKVVGYIELGKRETKLVCGGRYGPELVPSLPGGNWVEPTLFLTEDNSLRICQRRSSGPSPRSSPSKPKSRPSPSPTTAATAWRQACGPATWRGSTASYAISGRGTSGSTPTSRPATSCRSPASRTAATATTTCWSSPSRRRR
jgi:aldehyde dehydrogenase (NAD+)